MKIAVIGAGAIGAYVGAKLSAAGEDVALVARGKHLRAIQGTWSDGSVRRGRVHRASTGDG